MTNPDKTWIALIVDRSGSMESMRNEAQAAVQDFIKEQRELPGEAYLTLVQFDHQVQTLHDGASFNLIPAAYTLIPRGTTALFDAMGTTITSVGERLAAMPEEERPGKVLIVTVTDGLNNASKEYTKGRIKELVTQQTEQYGWEFAFLGVGIDAMDEGMSMGIRSNMRVDATSAGMRAGGQSLNLYASSYRTTGKGSWDAPDDPDGES